MSDTPATGNRRSLKRQPLSRPPTLVARVTEHVRQCIVDTEYRLGEAISEERIAASLEVSRTPVREALSALHMQGLVVIQPQRGTFVFLPTESEVAELCEFRMLMECRAMALCLARNKQATLERLRAANAAMHEAALRGDTLEFSRADSRLHNTLFELCGNQYLAQAYGWMASRFEALRNHLSQSVSQTQPGPVKEHEEIIEAFGAGDLQHAENLLSVHIFKMKDRFAAALASNALP